MKNMKYILASVVIALGMSSCVGDLTIDSPLDPNLNTADKALTKVEDYESLLASIYTGFATSGYEGANSGPSISGLDGGASQYYRGRYHLNGLTTDETVCCWNDQVILKMHSLDWTTEDVAVSSFYYRVCHQVGLCNEFIRQANAATIDLPEKARWIAEARALRALCWLDGIDNFGNMPFADENFVIGSTGPDQISRADLFSYIEKECKELLEGNDLYGFAEGPYGRANKGLAAMVLAKLYLNAEVYIGQKKYQECADVLATLDSAYSLHTQANGSKYSAFQDLFLADNEKCTDEIIFPIEQHGLNTNSYGVTTFFIFGFIGGDMPAADYGISSGWGGYRATPEFYNRFEDGDIRKLFDTENQVSITIDDYSNFKCGAAYVKFVNIKSDGGAASTNSFSDVDYPLFRYADALLMKAECELNGATGANGLASLNAVRARAGLPAATSLTAELILDERARELALEGWRRSDLVRFGKFTSDSYLWAYKGGSEGGQGVDSYRNLFPIPQGDLNANSKLTQNDGYAK